MKRKTRYMPRAYITELFSEKKTYMGFCKVVSIEIAKDGRSYQANVDLLEGTDRGLVYVGFSPSLFGHIKVGDILLCVFVGGNIDSGVAVALLPSELRKLHPKVTEEDTVITSLVGKNIHLSNNPTAVLDNPAVLGKELMLFIQAYTDNLNLVLDEVTKLKEKFDAHTHTINSITVAGSATTQRTVAPVRVPAPTASGVDVSSQKTKFTDLKGNSEDKKAENTLRWQSDFIYLQEKDKAGKEQTNQGA